MLHLSRSATILAVPLAIAALLGFVTPAGARLASNRLASNAVAQNAIPAGAHMTTGSALGDLNGVAVEEVTVPDTAPR